MPSLNPTQSSPSFPQVVGIDMPGVEPLEDSSASSVMTILLDVTPSRHWVAVFARQVGAFVDEQKIDDVRLVGRSLTLIGTAETIRKRVPETKALVYRVSRLCLQERVIERGGRSADVEGQQGATTAESDHAAQRDLDAVANIAGISSILEAVTRASGMRFAAVARVTDSRWTACAVYDLIEFGLRPGQDLVLESTICNEIRQHRHLVAFDSASSHPVFSRHQTPAMYGFESYVSLPILRADGSLFGTLCALDPAPAKLDPATIETLAMFARMIGLEIDANDPTNPRGDD